MINTIINLLILVSATGTYTASVYFKASERTFGFVYIYDGSTALRAWFNLSNGQIGTVQAGASAAISDAGNGWYRCSITRAITGNAAANAGFAVSSADNTTSYLGVVGDDPLSILAAMGLSRVPDEMENE